MRIFRENNHSRYFIRWKRIDAGKVKKIKNLILENYDFDFVSDDIRQVKEWERMSNNFKVRVKIGKKSKEVLFRKHIQLKDGKSVELLNKITKFLKDKGIPVPGIIATKSGGSFFKENGNFYVMYEFVSGDHYKGSYEELEQAASKIALLHKVLKEAPFYKEIKEKPLLLPAWTAQGWEKIFRQAALQKNKINQEVSANKDLITREAKKIKENYSKLEKLEKQAIHADLHPQNYIFRDGKLSAFLDFEGVREGELLRDVGNACHRLVRQFVVFQNKDFKKTLPKGIKVFLEEYGKINPIKKDEINLIPLLVSDELLRKLYKDISLYYSQGDSSRIEGGELEKKINLLKESKIIADYLKQYA